MKANTTTTEIETAKEIVLSMSSKIQVLQILFKNSISLTN